MTDTPARLLRLLSLLQLSREWPGSELAERLEVSPRTIRRDIDRLRDLGYPVEATMGATGGYRLVAGSAMPPLLLDDEEAVAIAVSLRVATGQTVAGIDEAGVRALAKLEHVLPARLRYRVRSLSNATAQLAVAGPTVDPSDLTTLAAAIANHVRVRFRYRAGDGEESRRIAEPNRLVVSNRWWYLVAFDNDRDDWRLFRADRIRNAQPTGLRFTPRDLPGGDAAAFVTARLHDLAPVVQAAVTFRAPAGEVRARLGDGAGEVEPIDADSCRFRSAPASFEWLAFRLTMVGCEFEVHEPPELAAHLLELAARVTRAAGVTQPRAR